MIEGARRVRLELAADWLVMAAWLTWLKSRLLVPDGAEVEEAELAADVLAARLRDLSAIRAAAVWLAARPQLGHDVFARGAPEDHTEIDRLAPRGGPGLAGARLCRRCGRRSGARRYQPRQLTLWTVKDALQRLAHCSAACRIGPAWTPSCRPLSAARWSAAPRLPARCWPAWRWPARGAVRLRQEQAFGPILVRRASSGVEEGA